MKSCLKALIFDLDGTLADTIPAITEAVNMALLQLEFPPRTNAEIESFIGRGPRYLMSRSLPDGVAEGNPDIVDLALATYDKTYEKTYMHTDKLYDGISEAVASLSERYTIAVLSNKQDEYVKALIKQLLPEGLCKAAYGTVSGLPAKPEPTVALKLADELGFLPEECILIGDSNIDILTAKNAEFESLSVSWGYLSKDKLYDSGATHVIDSPTELLEYFN